MIAKCLGINEKGHLTVSGVDTVELAREFGTPAYILDENTVRENCRTYIDSMKKYFGEASFPLFASKALSFTEIYRIVASEGMGIDCVSPGEIYTAYKAGYPMERAYFHGNNKTDADIEMALDAGVGCFVVDNREELVALDAAAGKRGKIQKILLRISPGIDPHTHRKVVTGSVDSKFGTAIETGQAMEMVKAAAECKNLHFAGVHCHIGSQIFDIDPFVSAADIMFRFIKDIKDETGIELEELNLGGGLGVPYVDTDPVIDYEDCIRRMADRLRETGNSFGLKMPRIILEPGRSIVAAAGVTLYTVGSFKNITGYKSYVSIDGGMPDNPRYALYNSQYTILVANRAGEERTVKCTVAGRCCESGDLIAEDIMLQRAERGDILAVLVTGAYNHSMASNYNKIPRPPMIIIKDGVPRVAIKRETFEDLIRNDV